MKEVCRPAGAGAGASGWPCPWLLPHPFPASPPPSLCPCPCSSLLTAFEQEALLDSSYFFCKQDSVVAAAQLLGQVGLSVGHTGAQRGAAWQSRTGPARRWLSPAGEAAAQSCSRTFFDSNHLTPPLPSPPFCLPSQLPLSVKDMFNFCMAPANATDLRLGAALLQFATKYR